MIASVSTVKDSLPNLERFVRQNLKNGIDHMFVFLDSHDPDGQQFLEASAHVTCVRTDEAWWNGARPARLNTRQSTNANLVKAVLAQSDWAQWIFHIDSDEVAHLDREVLEEVPAEVPAVRLRPLEAVSTTAPSAAAHHWKTLLAEEDLILLSNLGVIDRPSNGSYFHGHVGGKSGMRPRLDLWLAIHQVVDADRNTCEHHEAEALTLLHYESTTVDEFIRKWKTIVSSGPRVKVRESRREQVIALEALVAKNLPDAVAAPYFTTLYERTTEDDFATLRDLELLAFTEPEIARYAPRVLPQGAVEQAESTIRRLAAESKDLFRARDSSAAAAALQRAGR